MADTFTQIYIQVVFAVKKRENTLSKKWRDEVFRYISGIITFKDQKSIIVNGVGDHVHCFIGLKPTMALSDLVRDIKNNSSKFINSKKWLKGKFEWQSGFGAFSYSHLEMERVYDYILNQEKHHEIKSFKDEYLQMLNAFQIEFKEEYVFEWHED